MTPTTEELKDLLGKVTQGEWQIGQDFDAGIGYGFFVGAGGSVRANLIGPDQKADATLFALSPTLAQLVIDLDAEVVRLRDRVEELEEWIIGDG